MSEILLHNGKPGAAPECRAAKLFWRMRHLVLVALVTALTGAAALAAESLDDQYLNIVSLVREADMLKEGGKNEPALTKYQQALTRLQVFQQANRSWNSKAVYFRLGYISDKITSITGKPAGTEAGAGAESIEKKGASPSSPDTAVKLVGDGAEPRQALRLHPKAGDKQALTLSMKVVTTPKIGDMEVPPVKMPAINMQVGMEVKEVSATGDISYQMTVEDVTVADDPDAQPQLVESMKNSVAAAKGMSGTASCSSRGIGKAVEIKGAAAADPQAKQALDQIQNLLQGIGPKFPEQAVGVGAKWEFAMPVKSQGMSLQQTTSYEVTAIEGDRVELKTVVTQSAANQKVANPAMPQAKVDLKKMSGKGEGSYSFDLSKLAPSKGTSTYHGNFDMALEMAGQKQAMTMTIEMTFQVESK
jgi:hypothetical protein